MFTAVWKFFYHVYCYREYLFQSISRDLRKKYKRSFLGYIWSMLNPLLMMLILSVVFSSIMKNHVSNYPVFLFAAMLPWAFFDGTCNGCLGAIRANARIIDQVSMPKYLFLVAIALSNLVAFGLSVGPLLLVMLLTHHSFSLTILLMPIVMIPLFFFTMGIGAIVAVGNVFFEDTEHLLGVVLRAVYFLCPIIYSHEILSPGLVKWVQFNPVFGIIEAMRDIVYYGHLPDPLYASFTFLSSFLVLILGLWVFNKTENKFVYFI